MTVGELIEHLTRLPQGVQVLIEAGESESGWCNFTVGQRAVWPKNPDGYWDGEYKDQNPAWLSGPREPYMPAVVLERDVKPQTEAPRPKPGCSGDPGG